MTAIDPESGNLDYDWGLLAAAARGDEEAFRTLVERHQDRIVRLCERILGDREEARDGAQEVFLRVYRHAADAEPRGRLFTWLYRIALNHCFNRLRRRKIVRFFSFERAGQDGSEESVTLDPADGRPGAEADLMTRERWRATRRVIDALPEGQRAVLLLARFEGLSQREIAETLGITEGAVESRLVRAMRRLRGPEAQETASPAVSRGEP
ncbi:MAG: sigma-70 family RNA polymerase sigma factor [Thermoanaerobaculia bacterium]